MPRVSARDFTQYRIDEGGALGANKYPLASLLSAWEQSDLSCDEFTLCPSGACASLVVLVALKALGIKCIHFETPAYFGSLEQAHEIGLKYQLIPTYRKHNYDLPPIATWLDRKEKSAIWLTQPRAALGFDQDPETILLMLQALSKGSYLISDEVTDQSFPALLRGLRHAQPDAPLIRIRSFTKGMGLNGLRLATIIHPRRLRETVVNSLETLGGSIDAHSLIAITALAEHLSRFKVMLAAANQQVNDLRVKAERLTSGTNISVNHLTNGYIGSMVVDLSDFGRTQVQRRMRLLEWCRSVRTPIMLGATFYMAIDPPTEAIRLNFFSRPDHIIHGITNILGLWKH